MARFDVTPGFTDELTLSIERDWIDATTGGAWADMSPAERVGQIPSLLHHLLDLSLSDAFDPEARTALMFDAIALGEDRHARQFDETAMLGELYVLRGIVWTALRRAFGSIGAETAMARVDAALSAVSVASLHGLHRARLETEGKWPAIMAELTTPNDTDGRETPD